MYSLRELYKVGNGPSSSHTIGPLKATKEFLKRYPNVDYVRVVLYGSLALTGRGHLTDYIIEKTMHTVPCDIDFNINDEMKHPNTMEFRGYNSKRQLIGHMIVYSVGGGAIKIEGEDERAHEKIYPLSTFDSISKYCKDNKLSLVDYVDKYEDEEFNSYIETIFNTMIKSVENGIKSVGVLPGNLLIKRKARYIYFQNSSIDNDVERKRILAYAYAAAEENASGGEIVTAPTCGASGVVPAILCHVLETCHYDHKQIIDALKVAGLIGNIVKTNGSISGAEAGCQAEVGTACAMAAAFLAYLWIGTTESVERAAEIALEHHLGLTCDPISGYVQIPCIERNAVAALRAVDAVKLTSYLNNSDSKISFDMVVKTMLDTGKALHSDYRETSEGGLAKNYQ